MTEIFSAARIWATKNSLYFTVRIVVFLVFILKLTAPVQASLLFCSEPIVPTCAEDLNKYGQSDKWEFDECRDKLKDFKYQIESYANCLKNHVDGIISDYKEQIRKYNCKARGEKFCF